MRQRCLSHSPALLLALESFQDEFVPVEPPMSVIGYSPSLETSSSPGKKDDVPHRLEPTTVVISADFASTTGYN